MNTMKSFLLVILSLMPGCEALPTVKGCTEGWAEFTCTGSLGEIIITSSHGSTESKVKDKRENSGRIHWYHDTKNETFTLVIKRLKQKDKGKYTCKYKTGKNHVVDLELEDEQQGCKGPFNQTAYTTAKTTITCDDLKYDDESRVKFFCKEKGGICEEISSNGRFILTNTNSSFNMSISNVSSEDTGVYWCGLKSRGRGHRTALRKIQLEVQNITNFERSAMVGKTFKYWCNPKRKEPLKLFICKGEDPSTCKQLVSTAESNIKNGKFSLTETKKRNFTITVTNITADDAGTYWCGAESSDTGRSNLFFHRFIMTVAPSTSPPPSTQSTTASAETHGGFEVIITVIVCVAVLLLLLVLILILICKRFSHSKKTRNGTTAQHVREDYVYEEIQEHLPKPDRGNAMDTIYVSVNLPTNPSASLHYSTINFQNSSEKAGGKTPKPSSSTCEYSTVKTIQSPTYLTVIQPSTSMEDTLYSTVNKPQQQKGKIHPVRNI